MNQQLKAIQDFIEQNQQLSQQDKEVLLKSIKDADKEFLITEFKLDRTEKVKRTTAILLEETIEELEQKRKVVEEKNHELEIETALERVRSIALSMKEPSDMLEVCRVISQQLELLNVKEIRNVQTAIIYEDKGTYLNYEYYAKHDKLLTTEVDYKNHELQELFANQMLKGAGELFTETLQDKALQDWYDYQKTTNQFLDFHLKEAVSLNYYWFSLGPVALGISTYAPLKDEEINLFKRFRNVFELAYRRFLDIEKAIAQAREAQIELALERVRARTMAMQKSEELSDTAYELFQQFKELGENPYQITIGIIKEAEGFVEFNITGAHGSGAKINQTYQFDINEPALIQKLVKGWKENKKSSVIELAGKDLTDWVAHRNLVSGITDNTDYSNARRFVAAGYFTKGLISISTVDPIETNTCLLLERFAKVFEQTYTRFLDLQTAEAQAREAHIEAALERVRSRSLAMHKSTELQEVIEIVFQQILKLGILADVANFIIFNPENKDVNCWIASENLKIQRSWFMPYTDIYPVNALFTEKEKGNDSFNASCSVDEKNTFFNWAFEHSDFKYFPADRKAFVLMSKYWTISYAWVKHTAIQLSSYSRESFTESEKEILKRFAKVFEQSYTRFLDLQKAEAQSRESQIQLALERVRARTMAMQHSEELHETSQILFQQMKELGEPADQLTIGIVRETENVIDVFATLHGTQLHQTFRHSIDEPVVMNKIFRGWKAQQKSLLIELNSKELQAYNRYRNELVKSEMFPTKFSKGARRIVYAAYFSKGMLALGSDTPLTEESHQILERFAAVFDGTYTRFLDLQKAEAQTREAQIELSLERVRARAMAMHASEELREAAILLYHELQSLGIKKFINCGYVLIDERNNNQHAWMTHRDGTIRDGHQMPLTGDWVMNERYESWKRKDPIFVQVVGGKKLKNHLLFVSGKTYTKDGSDNILPQLPDPTVFYCAHFSEGYLHILADKELSKESTAILSRFTTVFEITFRRFLDLQKAEAQAREAQIELGLERVRARAMAMQKPDELVEVAKLLRREMGLLGVEELETSSIYTHDEATQKTECSYAIQQENKLVSDYMTIDLNDTDVGRQMLTFYNSNKKQISILMQGEARKEWINYCADHSKELVGFYGDEIPERTYHLYKFSNGYIGATSPGDISTESWDLLKRATNVFSLAYTRFSDLQKAEAQAREATIEAASERVRSRTLAMQKSDELAETAAVLFKQLINLGIAPNRLYIGIVKDDSGLIEFWGTDEDGTKVNTQFTGNTGRSVSVQKMYEGWRQQNKSLTLDMQGKELQDYFHYLSEELHVPFKRGLSQKRRVQTIAYFSKGFIGMASPDEQPEETTKLLERFASVFNLTFTRFNDLKIAEAHALQSEEDLIKLQAEKKRAEDALTELKSTQTQLIQSEKMASLGELTAGIAHEIQNPLNFVNNFSEVSSELIAEMKEELSKGNYEDVTAIANDVIQNLEKINHHGKRADAIVKGMLQHSRSSSGIKEPTDINALCDEYLRLSYHGLRAKDKSFNATIKTDFDSSIGNINIIVQDIGRVILNLLTNAFYAVNEKKIMIKEGYEPNVSISTKKSGSKVEINVLDNGNGIPEKILDKIFQPFFTTKPTGQGTGLGLSLSYDIVTKGHGGELKVETKNGEGTTFKIILPIS